MVEKEDKHHDDYHRKKRTEGEAARAEKAANKAAQRAEQATIKSSHSMNLRNIKNKNMPIQQP